MTFFLLSPSMTRPAAFACLSWVIQDMGSSQQGLILHLNLYLQGMIPSSLLDAESRCKCRIVTLHITRIDKSMSCHL